MAEATTPPAITSRNYADLTSRIAVWSLIMGLSLLIAAQLVFFAIHAAHLLRYPYPLDYGEGPLLAQVDLLRSGTPIWRLYGDPDGAPYAVVNYPPIYHLLTVLAALPLGNPLLAGRLVSLAATLAAVLALWLLTEGRPTTEDEPGIRRFSLSSLFRLLFVLAFLALPIVREWSVVMRVDMLGVCLGLWGLVIIQRRTQRSLFLAALLLALSLLVKPSLIAAPAAALVWLLLRDWRRVLVLGGLIGLAGGLVALLLELGSGGWFLLHVLAANANAWDGELAYKFWSDQMLIVWPLVTAAILSVVLQLIRRGSSLEIGDFTANLQSRFSYLVLPLCYTLFGAIVAAGVGKVGAYSNYFLEFYAGLIWLVASATERMGDLERGRDGIIPSPARSHVRAFVSFALMILLVIGGLLRYYPIWSATYLKLAGIIEGSNPPRLIVGGYGVWQDLHRERDILTTLSGVNAALVGDVQAASAPIFTDIPGLAAQAGQLSRLQAFEYRQLLDAGLADQRPLLRDMANGQVPLVVLDYLGNWLTPEMIAMIRHRYAQDGSRGTYDLYRPVDPGPAVAADLAFPAGLHLVGYHMARSPGRSAYHGGETVVLTLDWRQESSAGQPAANERDNLLVVTQLTDQQGQALFETSQPLLYGALPSSGWADATIQHMQPIALPPELPAGDYRIAISLRGEHDLALPQALAPLTVEAPAGRQLGESGYYVPAPLLEAWQRLGGDEGPGDPLMPAVPFQGATQQCFARACLRLVGSQAQQLPLGELVHLADVGLAQAPIPGQGSQESATALYFPQTGQALYGEFLDYWRERGGEDALGLPITPELIRGDRIVQYTRYARLERPASGGRVRLGRLGEEFLRLPGGETYRWP